MQPVTLRSDHAVLSTPVIGDVDDIAYCCQDSMIQHWTTVPTPYCRTDAARFIAGVVAPGWSAETSCTWGIHQDDNSRLVGMIGLDDIADNAAEVGFWLGPDARGLGLMNEAVQLVCDYGFAPDGLNLQRIQWHAYFGNTASAAVARRAGFHFEGTFRLGGVQRKTRLDNWQAALLPEDPRTPADGWPEETFDGPSQSGRD